MGAVGRKAVKWVLLASSDQGAGSLLASLGRSWLTAAGASGLHQTPAPTLSSDEQGALAVEDGVFRNRDS